MRYPNLRKPLIILALLASVVGLTGCANQDIGGDLVDIGITNGGIILETSTQSCVDRMSLTSPQPRSISGPALYFNGFSAIWKSNSLSLFIGEIKVTVKAKQISGGSISVDIDSTEIEALLGAINAQLDPVPTGATSKLYSSTSATKGKNSQNVSFAPCGLAVGGITFTNPTSTGQFIAQVKIELIGTASNATDLNQTPQPVHKTIYTTATFYGT